MSKAERIIQAINGGDTVEKRAEVWGVGIRLVVAKCSGVEKYVRDHVDDIWLINGVEVKDE